MVSDLHIARALGYPEYPEVDINDCSTFERLTKDTESYMTNNPWANYYYCWVSKLGCVTVGLKH